MLEVLLCSMVTILPDYLYRRYGQGKRFGRELTLFSVWYELRWGITGCVILTIALITAVFLFHPSTRYAATYFRTVPVLAEGIGRVEEVFVGFRQEVAAGDPLFRLDSSEQEAAVETARRRIAEVETAIAVARDELAVAESRMVETRATLQQALDEFETRAELQRRDATAIASREVERAQVNVDGRQAALDAAMASLAAARTKLEAQLPAERATAEAALEEAESALAKTTVYAGVDGRLEQFTLRPGDIVNPMLRPAGILVPREAGRVALEGGFGQIEGSSIYPGMIGEATCLSAPFVIVPLVVTEVQDVIAAGQLRPTDQLLDPQAAAGPGSIVVYMEALFESGLDRLPPGSSCIVNLYTSFHDRLHEPGVGVLRRIGMHGVDAIGLVHAVILRMQAILTPVRVLVLGGH